MLDQLTDLSIHPLYFIIFAGLISGLVGSTHCIGMCGGLVVAMTKNKKGVLSYHIGRLLGYSLIGVILPLLGLRTLGLNGNKTVSIIGALIMGGLFIYIGLKNLLKWKSYTPKHAFLENLNITLWQNLYKKFRDQEILRSFFGGSASVLLPCGLLWSILILSITAANSIYSLAFIVAFWLGTMPVLTFAPEIFQKILKPLQIKLPRTIPIVLIIIGVSTIGYRVVYIYNTHMCH